MVQSTLSKPKTAPRSLSRWLHEYLEQPDLTIKTQQRGNALHVLLESKAGPPQLKTLDRLVALLEAGNLDDALKASAAPVYRLNVYGRRKGEVKPCWSHALHLNQLDRHRRWLERQQAPVETTTQATSEESISGASTSAVEQPASAVYDIVQSSLALAQQGEPDAIARYLSEELSGLGISVRVAVKPTQALRTNAVLDQAQRLWVLCEASYSVNPAATAELLASRLRGLALEGFQDAAVFSQVRGEAKPDWSLRVDLTSPTEFQRKWAQWGDSEAIVRLVLQHLRSKGHAVEVRPQLRNKNLNLFVSSAAQPPRILSPQLLRDEVAPLLKDLAPQGIHAATIHCLKPGGKLPPALINPNEDGDETQVAVVPSVPTTGIEWIALPASEHRELAPTTLELAEQGHLEAVDFLLTRLLNPDLEVQLKTGGLRVQLLRKDDLLHVMCDAPRCPGRRQIARPIAKYIRQLRLPKVAGLRIYGRRAGQAMPHWQYGRDFIPRQGSSELPPQFQVTEVQGGDLLTRDAETMGAARAPWTIGRAIGQSDWQLSTLVQPWLERLSQGLVKSQLFLPADAGDIGDAPVLASALVPESAAASAALSKAGKNSAPLKVASIWAALGIVLAGSLDLFLGQLVAPPLARGEAVDLASAPNALGDALLGSDLGETEQNLSDFLRRNPGDSPTIAALIEQYPSFNNDLFDEKLALYRQRVAEEGPPDILIMGSSRALRGVDPEALVRGLRAIGKSELKVFNFSINGSTAQVVELQLMLILEGENLPGMILWADGARAFNSGREDSTYEAISQSDAYQELIQNTLPALFDSEGTLDSTAFQQNRPLVTRLFSLGDLDSRLDAGLGRLSAIHNRRDQLKARLGDFYAQGAAELQLSAGFEPFDYSGLVPNIPEGEGFIDFNGFMPLSMRFNPATYYQQYSLVTGQYDKDYQSFRMEGPQMRALDNIVHVTGQYGVPLVFVNLPLTSEYLDPVRSRYEAVFQKKMFQRMTQRQLVFRDLSQLWPEAVDNFSDPSHLNLYGAKQVSNHLADDPMIPWPSLAN